MSWQRSNSVYTDIKKEGWGAKRRRWREEKKSALGLDIMHIWFTGKSNNVTLSLTKGNYIHQQLLLLVAVLSSDLLD